MRLKWRKTSQVYIQPISREDFFGCMPDPSLKRMSTCWVSNQCKFYENRKKQIILWGFKSCIKTVLLSNSWNLTSVLEFHVKSSKNKPWWEYKQGPRNNNKCKGTSHIFFRSQLFNVQGRILLAYYNEM